MKWTNSKKQILEQQYGKIPTVDLSKIIGLSEQAIRHKAMELKLRFTKQGIDNKGKFMRGHQPYNKGKYLSKKTKEKISRKRKEQGSPWISKRNREFVREKSFTWKGGKYIDGSGYIRVLKPEHPNSNKAGYIGEHVLIMQKHLGRILTKKEIVHHIDGNKLNNKIGNLQLFPNSSAHMRFHMNIPRFSVLNLKERLKELEKEFTDDEYTGAFTLIESLEVKGD